jgi:hypothetical protein
VSDLDPRPAPHAAGFSTRAIQAPAAFEDLQADLADALAAARAAVPALGAV